MIGTKVSKTDYYFRQLDRLPVTGSVKTHKFTCINCDNEPVRTGEFFCSTNCETEYEAEQNELRQLSAEYRELKHVNNGP